MKAFLDTNILVDLVLAREQFLPEAQRIFALGYAGECDLIISALSFVTTVFLAQKYKYPTEEVRERLLRIAEFSEIANLRGRNVVDMLNSGWKDYEDATQYRCAIESNADCIITRNKRDFIGNEIAVLTPSEFLSKKLNKV